MKSRTLLSLLISLQACTFIPTHTHNSYTNLDAFFNFYGAFCDLFVSRGNLSEENQELFEEVARSLNIAERKIKVKNAGILLRLLKGYNNPQSEQFQHRVYINEDWFNTLPDKQKRFLMTQLLFKHRYDHGKVELAVTIELVILRYFVTRILGGMQADDGLVKQYFTRWLPFPCSSTFFDNYNLYTLLMGQLKQKMEKSADRDTVTIAELDPDDGIELMKEIYKPDTRDWPGYAQLQMALYRSIIERFRNLPFFKQHNYCLASYEDRVAHFKKLKEQWLEIQREYEA